MPASKFHGKRGKRLFVAVAVPLAVVLILVSAWAYAETTRLNELVRTKNIRISNLQTELSDTQGEYATYKRNAEDTIAGKNAEIVEKADRITRLEADVSNLQLAVSGLERDVQDWQDRYSETYSELQMTSQELSQAQAELDELSALTSESYSQLTGMLEWVDKNAYLPSSIWDEVHTCGDPVTVSGGDCYVNTYDLGQDMVNCFDYSLDETRGDSQSVSTCKEFWKGKSGDCDDFALFAAAWLRKEIEESSCENIWVVLQDQPSWVCDFAGCDRKTVTASPDDVYVVCGALADGSGHCVVGISKGDDIGSEEELRDIRLFEPQGGKYLGDEFTNLHAIISDSDLMFYNGWEVSRTLLGIKKGYDEFIARYGVSFSLSGH